MSENKADGGKVEEMENVVIYALSDGDANVLAPLLTHLYDLAHFPYVLRVHGLLAHRDDLEAVFHQALHEPTLPRFVHLFASDALAQAVEAFCASNGCEAKDLYAFLTDRERPKRQDDSRACTRWQAMDFTTHFDDGKHPEGILEADVCLTGVSRTSKTPLSVYLASRNLRVANVPLLPESPPPVELYRLPPGRIFGLTASVERLMTLRRERLKSLGLPPDAAYASEARIREELRFADDVMKKIGCAIIDVSLRAVEESAEIILRLLAAQQTDAVRTADEMNRVNDGNRKESIEG